MRRMTWTGKQICPWQISDRVLCRDMENKPLLLVSSTENLDRRYNLQHGFLAW